MSLISFDDAFNIVMSNVRNPGEETIDFTDSSGRVLAEDVISDINVPPFNKSAMDGYACRSEDVGKQLLVIEEIPAGHDPVRSVGGGQCSKIMTGGRIPDGADCVIIIEDTESPSEGKVMFIGDSSRYDSFRRSRKKSNICMEGEDIRAGDAVVTKGTLIMPQHIAVLATVGCTKARVSRQPRVGIIATGSELVEPSARVEGSRIRNSNSYQLAAQVRNSGSIPVYYGIAEDTEEKITGMLDKALSECDVVLLSGGVSMGDYDLVPGCLGNTGVRILFDRVAVQPGKPVTFGVSERAVCFGMPGNPVSTFIQFEFLVKPYLYRMMGHTYEPVAFGMALGEDYKRKNSERMAIIPVRIKDNQIFPVEYHGSAHINALSASSHVMVIPQGTSKLSKGEFARVRLIG